MPDVLNEHDMLVEIYTMCKGFDKSLNGNGQPGLVAKVAALEANQVSLKADAAKGGAKAGVATGLMMAVVGAILAHFGVKLPS